MLDTVNLDKIIIEGYPTLPQSAASFSGHALAPHGGCDGMLCAYEDATYLVPMHRTGNTITYSISEAQFVIDDPTGYAKDMELLPIAVMSDQLKTALAAAIQTRHPKAGTSYTLELV